MSDKCGSMTGTGDTLQLGAIINTCKTIEIIDHILYLQDTESIECIGRPY